MITLAPCPLFASFLPDCYDSILRTFSFRGFLLAHRVLVHFWFSLLFVSLVRNSPTFRFRCCPIVTSVSHFLFTCCPIITLVSCALISFPLLYSCYVSTLQTFTFPRCPKVTLVSCALFFPLLSIVTLAPHTLSFFLVVQLFL